MPIYEFICKSCHNKFELLRPFSKAGESACCPVCKNEAGRIMSSCVSRSSGENGIPQNITGNSCTSCSSGNCSSCGN